MEVETVVEYGMISNFQWLVTLTLTLDRVILHTVVHHSSTSTYKYVRPSTKRFFDFTSETPAIASWWQ